MWDINGQNLPKKKEKTWQKQGKSWILKSWIIEPLHVKHWLKFSVFPNAFRETSCFITSKTQCKIFILKYTYIWLWLLNFSLSRIMMSIWWWCRPELAWLHFRKRKHRIVKMAEVRWKHFCYAIWDSTWFSMSNEYKKGNKDLRESRIVTHHAIVTGDFLIGPWELWLWFSMWTFQLQSSHWYTEYFVTNILRWIP